MALKSYSELRQVDVTPYCDDRDGVKYLNWAKCVDLLHENGAEKVYFIPLTNSNGSSLFMSDVEFKDSKNNTNRCYETRIEIHIDDLVFQMQSPVMNGANPVKDNSMSQQRLWNSMTRSFVKGVAIHTGLGFDLWLKEEKETTKKGYEDMHHDILKVRERIFEYVTTLQKDKNMSLDDIAKKLGKDREDIEIMLKQYVVLAKFENELLKLL